MANKTLYVSDSDQALWERAAKVAEQNRQTLSALVHTALAKHIGGEFETLTIMRGKPFHEERFEGRWLTKPDTGEDDHYTPSARPDASRFRHFDGRGGTPLPPESWRAWIGETSKGNIVIYIHHWNFDSGTDEVFEVFKTFDEASSAFRSDPRIPGEAWDEAARKLRGASTPQVVWLDI
jgi:hypothetical protein